MEKLLCSECDKFRCICPKPPSVQQMEPTPITTLFRRQNFSAIFPVMSSSSRNSPSTNTNDNNDNPNSNLNLPETKNWKVQQHWVIWQLYRRLLDIIEPDRPDALTEFLNYYFFLCVDEYFCKFLFYRIQSTVYIVFLYYLKEEIFLFWIFF